MVSGVNLNIESNNLEEELGVKKLNLWLINVDNASRLGNNSLGGNSCTLLIRLSFLLVVFADTVEEVYTRGRKSKMFYSNMDTFRDDSASNLLIDNDSDGSGVYVKDTPSSTVVVFVWHTLVNGSINADVNDISNLI